MYKWVIPYAVTAALTLAGPAFLHNCSRAQQTHPRVLDGDTLVVGGEHIRLYGIDAPEKEQRCLDGFPAGYVAKWTLQDLVRAGTIHIERHGLDRYKRTLAVVTNELLGDVNAQMVERGMAWAYMQYSWRYGAEQAVAKGQRLGVWAHDCETPWDWRHKAKR